MKIVGYLIALVASVALVACAPAPPPPEKEPLTTGLENGSFVANLNGFDIHYEVHGQGPVLMVVPQSSNRPQLRGSPTSFILSRTFS